MKHSLGPPPWWLSPKPFSAFPIPYYLPSPLLYTHPCLQCSNLASYYFFWLRLKSLLMALAVQADFGAPIPPVMVHGSYPGSVHPRSLGSVSSMTMYIVAGGGSIILDVQAIGFPKFSFVPFWMHFILSVLAYSSWCLSEPLGVTLLGGWRMV